MKILVNLSLESHKQFFACSDQVKDKNFHVKPLYLQLYEQPINLRSNAGTGCELIQR